MAGRVEIEQKRLERLTFLLTSDDEEAVTWRKKLSRAEYVRIWREYQILKQTVGLSPSNGGMREAVLVAG